MSSSSVRSLALACALALTALAAAWSPSAQATALQPNFNESVVFGGLTEPTDLDFTPDGRVFVAEKSGLIKVFSSLSATSPTIAVDLRTQVYSFWDRGLLSIELDPQFPIRPYLYAFYTYDAAIGETAPRWGQPGAVSDPCPSPTGTGCLVSSRLSKLTLSGSTVTSEQVLINDWCQQYPSHSAGGLAFGPEGMLYASGGDGASFTFTDYGQQGQPVNPCGDPPVPVGGAQTAPTAEGGALRSQDILTPSDPVTLDGSLIRIDPDTGAGVPGNPMFASSDPNARRIFATGTRNPFRIAPRPGTSEIYFGDVGWGTWEEINRIPKADDGSVDNFGWPCYEGNLRQPAYEGAGLNLCKQLYNTPGSVSTPLYTYQHGIIVVPGEDCNESGGSSISGLAFYQGGNYPAAYSGALFFADYSRRCTWVIFVKNGQVDPSTITSFARDHDPVNVEIGPGGDLFVVDFKGSVRRVTYAGGNRPPSADATATPPFGALPLTVDFDGTGSTDPDTGDSLTYAWDLDGDGQYDDAAVAKPKWTYTSAATITVGLRVTDKGGMSATDTVVIGAGNEPPQAHIDTPTAALKWAVGETVSFSGGGTDPQQGALGAASMSWNLVLRHCTTLAEEDCHSHPIESYPGVSEGKFTTPDHDYPSHFELRLTVTDSGGLSDTETLRLDPRTVDLTFASDPPGLSLGVGQQNVTAPVTRTVIVGSTNSVAAPTPQSLSGSLLGYSSWSDGGSPAHEIVAPEAPTTYTATFKPETATGLVLAYGFEETSGAAGDASTAKNNGTVNGATRTASGKFGRALSFDGVNDRVDVPDAASLDLSGAMTLEAWVRPTTNSGWRSVLFKERGTTSMVYALYSSNGSKPTAENFTAAVNATSGPTALALNAWTHLATTYDGTALRLYVNGVQVASKALTGSMTNTANPLRIGGNVPYGDYFSGLIDEVRVYNRALSAAEIGVDMGAAIGSGGPPTDTTPPSAPANLKATGSLGKVTLSWDASTDDVGVTGYEVYRSTTAGFTPAEANRVATPSTPGYIDPVAAGTYYYRVKAVDATPNLSAASAEASGTALADNPPAVSLTSPAAGTVSGAVTLKATAGDDVGVSGVQFLVDGAAFGAEDSTAPYEISWPSTAVANGTHKLSARARDTAGQTTTSTEVTVTVSNAPPPGNGLVLAYGFEETSGAAGDASTAKNNGTVNGATRTASGKFGRALSFDGVNDRVDVPDAVSLDLSSAMTLEAWVRPTTNSGWRSVLFKERGTTSMVYALYSSNGSKPTAENFTAAVNATSGPTALALNAWTHLATTYDGTALRLYVNGVQVASKALTGSMTNTANPLRIGGNVPYGDYFSGLIDEVRVYNRALSAAEIGVDMGAAVVP